MTQTALTIHTVPTSVRISSSTPESHWHSKYLANKKLVIAADAYLAQYGA